MKVKVGDKIYDGEVEPVMVILTPGDKWNISHMGDQTCYASFPITEEYYKDDFAKIKDWMKIDNLNVPHSDNANVLH